MTESPPDKTPHRGGDSMGVVSAPSPEHDRVGSLRGASPVSVGRKFWLVSGAIALFIVAVALAISFVSVTNDNARINRMKTHGVPVSVTVTICAGNVGGSGSNAAGYTCHGEYSVRGTKYHELIGSMVTFVAAGTHVRGVVDPSHHGTVVLASAIRGASASTKTYVAPGLLTVLLAALLIAFIRMARRPTPQVSLEKHATQSTHSIT